MAPGPLAARQHEVMWLPGKDQIIRTHLGIAGRKASMRRSPSSRSPRGCEEVGKAQDCVGGLCLGHDFGENVDLKQELTARLLSASPTQPAWKSVMSTAAKGETVRASLRSKLRTSCRSAKDSQDESQQHHATAEHQIRIEARCAISRDCKHKLTKYLTNSKDCECLEHKKNKYIL
jgi:hypothetical protein